MAMDRACHLLELYADAEVLEGIVIHDKVDKKEKKVSFKCNEIESILGIELTNDNIKTELERLDFPYKLEKDLFTVTIPRRRLDVDPNVNDIAEEIGRLYGYQNLKSTLPNGFTRRGEYVGDVRIRKLISKRLRSLGLNECKTYTLTSPEMANIFKYDNREAIKLPNAMSIDKSVIRTSIIPSLLNTYEYNKARNVKDINIYEIAKTYDTEYKEISKVAMLMKGSYIYNEWQGINIKVDFYVLKGIVCNLLDYLGFKNRYSFVISECSSLQPGIRADILLDCKAIGIIGKVNPSISKDEIYVCELSMKDLYEASIKQIKFKSPSKYPDIVKDVAFIIDNKIDSDTIKNTIKKEGKRILKNCEVFDLYPNIIEGKKSIAYKLTFGSDERTLDMEEVMLVFNNIIKKVCNEYNAELRDK